MDCEYLKALPRRQLQRLAMDRGIKANLKSQTIIQMLLQPCQKFAAPPGPPPGSPPTQLNLELPAATGTDRGQPVSPQRKGSGIQGLPSVRDAQPSQPPQTEPSTNLQQQPNTLSIFTISSASRAPWPAIPADRGLGPGADRRLRNYQYPRAPSPSGSHINPTLSDTPSYPPGTQIYSLSTGIPADVLREMKDQIEGEVHRARHRQFDPRPPEDEHPLSAAARAPVPEVNDRRPAAIPIPVPVPEAHDYIHQASVAPTESDWSHDGPPLFTEPSHISQFADFPWTPSTNEQSGAPPPLFDSAAHWERGWNSYRNERARSSAPAPPFEWEEPEQADPMPYATDEELRSGVCRLACAAVWQKRRRDDFKMIGEETDSMKTKLDRHRRLLLQESAHFERMNVFVHHVRPGLEPKWRDEVIWDKACRTRVDDEGLDMEIDTDEEEELSRNYPDLPDPVMIRWNGRRRAPSTDDGHAANKGHSRTPKRGRAEYDDVANPAKRMRAAKRMRGSAGATPASKAARAAVNRRDSLPTGDNAMGCLCGIIEEEEQEEQEERDIISILTQSADGDDGGMVARRRPLP